MNDRIKKIMQFYNMSATQFASEIGIQRSALSHIMSGRNKPSLDFMIKLKTRFDEINSDWLLFGKGNMLEQAEKNMPDSNYNGGFVFPDEEKHTGAKAPMAKSEEVPLYLKKEPSREVKIKNESSKPDSKEDSIIEKIVIFYKNGRFKSYQPE